MLIPFIIVNTLIIVYMLLIVYFKLDVFIDEDDEYMYVWYNKFNMCNKGELERTYKRFKK